MTSLPKTIDCLQDQVNKFEAGQIRFSLNEWEKITSDTNILDMVKGVHIDFSKEPEQKEVFQPVFNKEETSLI